MVYFYRLSASWYETYEHWELTHPKKYDAVAFKAIVDIAVEESITLLIKKDGEDWDWIGTDELMEEAVKILLADRGFTELVVQGKYALRGSNIIREGGDVVLYYGDTDEHSWHMEDKEYPRVNEYNKAKENAMHQEWKDKQTSEE